MARGDDEKRKAEGDAAQRRLVAGIARSRALIDQYRGRLLRLRKAEAGQGRGKLVPRRG